MTISRMTIRWAGELRDNLRHAIETRKAQLVAWETLEGDNAWSGCEVCAKRSEGGSCRVPARKGVVMGNLPALLMLQLKRFTFGAGGFYGYGGGSGKISSHVAFEPTWDITRFSTALFKRHISCFKRAISALLSSS